MWIADCGLKTGDGPLNGPEDDDQEDAEFHD